MAFANGSDNVALGAGAMNSANGNANVAIGSFAGLNFGGNVNIAIGYQAGQGVIGGGSNNILIGHQGGQNDEAVIRIGTRQKQTFMAGINRASIAGGTAVVISNKGQLGVATSSTRFKQDIRPMEKASEAVLSLKPVTFHYKKELDPDATPQFGLVAEDVAKVDPELVARDEQGKPFTVRYDAINAMMLNEFLKEHRKVEAQGAELRSQGEMIAALQSALEEQAAQLQQVKAKVQANAPAQRLVESR